MNKLEKKLRELGYKTYNGYAYLKSFFVNDYYFECLIALNKSKTKVKDYFLTTPVFRTYKVVNAFLKEFNKFKKDLEVLKEYEL